MAAVREIGADHVIDHTAEDYLDGSTRYVDDTTDTALGRADSVSVPRGAEFGFVPRPGLEFLEVADDYDNEDEPAEYRPAFGRSADINRNCRAMTAKMVGPCRYGSIAIWWNFGLSV